MADKPTFGLKRDVRVPWDMMTHPAFITLSGTEKYVLLRFLQKRPWSKPKHQRRGAVVYQNDGLQFSYAEALHFGIARSTLANVFRVLIRRGFLDVQEQGGPFNREATKYRYIELWRAWDAKTNPVIAEKPKAKQAYRLHRGPGGRFLDGARICTDTVQEAAPKDTEEEKPQCRKLHRQNAGGKVLTLRRARD